MFVVIFEVQPKAERWSDYLETARLLRPELEQIDGFIDNERFRDQQDETRILSLSSWRDEKALIRWRTQATHHTSGQQRGRFEIFANYHLRVGEVVADTKPTDGARLQEQRFNTTEVGEATTVTIAELEPGYGGATGLQEPAPDTTGLVARVWYESLTQAGKRLLLLSWADDAAAAAWMATGGGPDTRLRRVRIIRDYGMRDRREAPQYFPDVQPPD